MECDGRLATLLRQNRAIAALLDRFDRLLLPDCWLVAGCLAQTVWNVTAGAEPMAGIRDLDLIYHDPADLSTAGEAAHEARLACLFPALGLRLDVKNQARVHLWYEAKFGRAIPPFASSAEAIAGFPATATAIGIRMQGGRLELCAPYGIDDLMAGVVRANKCLVSRAVYEAKAAHWAGQWPQLRIIPWQHCG